MKRIINAVGVWLERIGMRLQDYGYEKPTMSLDEIVSNVMAHPEFASEALRGNAFLAHISKDHSVTDPT